MIQQNTLTIATRESPLALWQANWIKTQLHHAYPNLQINLLGITTQADKTPYISLAEIGGKGLFVKELEEALIDRRADIAVHSMKDMPMELPSGLCLPVMCAREDPWDVLISNQYASLNDIPAGAIIGTASVRRQSQLLHYRPDISVQGLRGNVNTRLNRLDAGEFAAIILAAAGIKRLNLSSRIREVLSPEQFLPAPGQGVLGIECQQDDNETQQIIAMLNNEIAFTCVTAERAMCGRLGGGCQVPIASYATFENNEILLKGRVAKLDGSRILHAEQKAAANQAEVLGIRVAEELLRQGAGEILQTITRRS